MINCENVKSKCKCVNFKSIDQLTDQPTDRGLSSQPASQSVSQLTKGSNICTVGLGGSSEENYLLSSC